MRINTSVKPVRVGIGAIVGALVVAIAAAPAQGAADPARVGAPPGPEVLQDPGRWYAPPAKPSSPRVETTIFTEAARQYAAQYGVSEATAREHLAEQGRGGGLEADLRARLGHGFGQLSFDHERGSFEVLVTNAAAEADARTVLVEHGIEDATFGRSEWSAAELDAALTRLSLRLSRQQDAGAVAIRRVADAGLVVQVDPDAPAAATDAVELAADAGPVRPKIVREQIRRPLAAACSRHYCDAPVVAGVRYINADSGCSFGFAAYVSGSSNRYNLTAGHCISVPNWPNPGRANYTCNAAQTSCPYVNHDLGGYYTGVGRQDGGVMAHTNASFPNYAGIRTWGWAFDTYSVHGTGTATLNQFVCKSGYRIASVQCGTVISTNNGHGQFVFDRACTLGGDSGGPIYDPANLYALGITATLYGTGLDGPCDTNVTQTGGEPVTRIVSSTGLSGVSVG